MLKLEALTQEYLGNGAFMNEIKFHTKRVQRDYLPHRAQHKSVLPQTFNEDWLCVRLRQCQITDSQVLARN